jgi:hypothetical protein
MEGPNGPAPIAGPFGPIINGKMWVRLFVVSMMNISRLKKSSYGYYAYAYANRKLWITEDPFEPLILEISGS